jgi:hypothetical protein
LHYSFVK